MTFSRMTFGVLLLTGIALAPIGVGFSAEAPLQAPSRKEGHGKPVMAARAQIEGEGVKGDAVFEEFGDGILREVHVRVTVAGPGLKPGLHGVHLHAVGKCQPDFAAAGGHFDPGPAGNSDPDVNHPFHMGDIPNLNVSSTNQGKLEAVTTRVTLSAGPLSLFDADGSAIIIHGNPDQGIPGEPKSGISGGPRIACGVIEKR